MKKTFVMMFAAAFAALSLGAAEAAAPAVSAEAQGEAKAAAKAPAKKAAAKKPAAKKPAAKKPAAKKAVPMPADGGLKNSTTPTYRQNPNAAKKTGWHSRYAAKAKQIADYKNDVEIVFIGDSITHYWDTDSKTNVRKIGGLDTYKKYFSNYKLINLGYSGDRTQHALWIAAKSPYLDNIKPKMVTVMIGTNNIGHNASTPEAAAAGVTKVVEALRTRLPETKIVLFGVFPRDAKANTPRRKKVTAINNIISKLADDKNVYYCDITEKFLDKNGNLPKSMMPDFLHPNDNGYEVWAQAMMPYVEKFVGKK